MKVIIREAAEDDLDRIFAWIAKDNPRAAADMVSRIRDRITRLELDPLAQMGVPASSRVRASLSNIPTSSFTKFLTSTAKFSCSRSFTVHEIERVVTRSLAAL
jgi:plasmid stabilization system protein ParE